MEEATLLHGRCHMATHTLPQASAQDPPPQPCHQATMEGCPTATFLSMHGLCPTRIWQQREREALGGGREGGWEGDGEMRSPAEVVSSMVDGRPR
jgi:hypothetical protein